MNTPVAVTIRHIEHSDPLAERARDFAQRLRNLNEHVTQCQITIEGAAHGTTPCYRVKIDLALPRAHIHADDGREGAHTEAGVALREAFYDAKQQLLALDRRRAAARMKVVTDPALARVVR